jgi:predicted Co/Zn/Cd cation transporter (cation efflux family)
LSIVTATHPNGARRVCDWVQLIRQQFQQTPQLCVTAEQASRLWGMEAVETEAVLSAFVDAHLLNRTRGGAYSLRLDPTPPARGSAHWPSC